MMPGRWRMKVTFDDPGKVPGAMEFWREHGHREMREFILYLIERWGLFDEEDLYDSLAISDADRTVTATQDLIDAFCGVHEWLIMHTSPVEIVFERVGER